MEPINTKNDVIIHTNNTKMFVLRVVFNGNIHRDGVRNETITEGVIVKTMDWDRMVERNSWKKMMMDK